MDPLSLTTAVFGFAGICAAIVKAISNLKSRFQDLPQTLLDLERGMALMTAVLPELERTLQANQDTSTGVFHRDQLAFTLEGCRATLECLRADLERLLINEKWTNRLPTPWKEKKVSKMGKSLEKEKGNVLLITTTLNM